MRPAGESHEFTRDHPGEPQPRAPAAAGLTFDGGRINDMLGSAWRPHGYQQKRWIEGEREYYDDEWGNLWVRMWTAPSRARSSARPSRIGASSTSCRPPDYAHPDCAARMRAALQPAHRQVQAGRTSAAGSLTTPATCARWRSTSRIWRSYPDEVQRMHADRRGGLRAEDPPGRQGRRRRHHDRRGHGHPDRACSSARACSASTSRRCTRACWASPTTTA